MKKISILLVITIIVSALLLPGFAYAKKPAGTPGKGPAGLAATGKPSAPPGLTSNLDKKKHGKLKFALRGKVLAVNSGANTFDIEIRGGTWKRIAKLERPDVKKGSTVTVTVTEATVFKLKKDRTKKLTDLKTDPADIVNVKGTIEGTGASMKLKARLVIIKPRPAESNGDD